MLTRLKVSGFKNLAGVEVRFGPFTCVAGENGAGKSNLFDAILFLGALAEKSLLEAVTTVRGETRGADALRVFSHWPGGGADSMSFEADILVPPDAGDDLGQSARAATTLLRYSLTIKARAAGAGAIPRLEVVDERLDYVRRSGQGPVLPFARGKKAWRDSVLRGKRTSPFISTEQAGGETFIRVHEDSGHQGRARKVKADGLGRTVLSTLNTAETPTALVARREMQSWQLLQLEPARLRGPDDLKAGARLGPDGRGLAATLQRLLAGDGGAAAGAVRARLAQRLLELNDDVEDVWVDRDEGREALTLMARSRDGVEFRARDLSDGTLRFLALAVLEQDPTWSGLLCLEEPENGIHPTRLPAMLELLGDMAADLDRPAGADNPLRQVIVNTHSPQVVGLAPDDCMIFAGSEPGLVQGQRIRSLSFLPLDGTWRAAGGAARSVSKEAVLQFLNVLPAVLEEEEGAAQKGRGRRPRVAERDGIRQMLLFPGEEAP